MSKFCQNCGIENEDTAKFCRSCGTQLVTYQQVSNQNQYGQNPNYTNVNNQPSMNNYNDPNYNSSGPVMVPFRNPALCLVLAFVTCGIYELYWAAVTNDEIKKINNDQSSPSGILVVILSILTCGIYFYYWAYKQGKKLYQAGQNYGVAINDNSAAYLTLTLGSVILSFFLPIPFLSISGLVITLYLIQTDLNKFSSGK